MEPIPKTQKQPKPPKCKNCGNPFARIRTTQVACSPACAMEIARSRGAKAAKIVLQSQRKELREARAKLKSRGEWLKEAQAAFNAWIRHRDKDLPCVSCGRYHQGQYHAGHFMPTSTRPSLRFDERNVHKQCSACNNHLHGNLTNYRLELINRRGLTVVEFLEGDHEPKKYTIEDLKLIKSEYAKMLRERIC